MRKKIMDDSEKSIIQRIIEVRTIHSGPRGKNKFAKNLGISPSTYSYYEKDRIPPVPVLVRISEIANIDLNWLLTGKNAGNTAIPAAAGSGIFAKIQRIIAKQPKTIDAIMAFLDLLDEKYELESKAHQKTKFDSTNGWIPVLGRTAAGIASCWNQAIGTDPKIVETQIEQLVKKYLKASIVNSLTSELTIDSQAKRVIQSLNKSHASLIQTVGLDDEIVQFVDCPAVHSLYPDSFALQVDGDSMSPRINDGDVVIVSPSVGAVEGLPAIVRVANAIGVTCKLLRNNEKFVHLIPINEKYETKIVDKNDILWSLAVLCHIKIKN